MPLAFPSINQGTVAFGFFNIETDMLLLEHDFFFAERFSAAVVALAESDDMEVRASVSGWHIAHPAHVGDLAEAIRGDDVTGFIGTTYVHFPFPEDPAAFRQSPEGWRRQALVEDLIEPFGDAVEIDLVWKRDAGTVAVSSVIFAEETFARLVGYVERGGYPRWKDDVRPDYVDDMLARLRELGSPLLPS